MIVTVEAQPFPDQQPGTSGLRKPTGHFAQPHYLELFIQSAFDELAVEGRTLVLGGDGRFFNDRAIQSILRIAAANGVSRMIVGRNGLLSTPAASALIRSRKAHAGIILSASHNPGGPDGDVGVKINMAHGGPSPAPVTDAIFARSKRCHGYRIWPAGDVPLDRDGLQTLGAMQVEIIDSVGMFADLMESQFDFGAIASLFRGGFTMRFDAMNAVTGPYAMEIFERRLGAPAGTVMRATPLPDFGGVHPDPNIHHAEALYEEVVRAGAVDFGAASDGDGDRNLILGPGMVVSPSDSLAVIVANAHRVPAFAKGLAGVARSMPTSRALDRVAARLGIPLFVTPTGWKFFANLLEAGRITICGEESAGTGSDHVREKDGLWAVLMWLSILAARRLSVAAIMHDHWASFGRDYSRRLDFEGLETDKANRMMQALRDRLPALPGSTTAGLTIRDAGDFSYVDPVDGSVASGQGIQLVSEDARIVYRLSGTGTRGATLRVYLERNEPRAGFQDLDPGQALADLRQASLAIAETGRFTGETVPTLES